MEDRFILHGGNFYPPWLKRGENYINAKKPMYTSSGDAHSHAISLCNKLVKQVLACSSKESEDVLSKYLRNCPIESSIEFCKLLEKTAAAKGTSTIEEKVWETVSGSVSSQIHPALNKARKINRLQNVLEQWTMLLGSRYLVNTFKHKFAEVVTDILLKTTHRSVENVGDIVRDMCARYTLFDEQQDQLKLMEALANSTVQQIHDVFISLARIHPIDGVLLFVGEETFIAWFDKSMLFSARSRLDSGSAILSLYKHFGELVCIPEIRERPSVTKLLAETIADELNKCELKDVLRMSRSIENLPETDVTMKQLYKHQVKELLEKKCATQDPYNLIISICSTSGDLLVNSSVTADLVTSILEVACPLQGQVDEMETFGILVNKYKMWKLILDVTGKKREHIMGNKHVVKATECINTVLTLLRKRSIKYSFIKQLDKHEENAKRLLAYGDGTWSEIRRLWKEAKTVCHEEREKVQCVNDVLEQVYINVREEFLPDGFNELMNRIKCMEMDAAKGIITAKQCMTNEGLWAGMYDLPDICKFLKSVIQSRVFWNVCQKNITEKSFLVKDDKDYDTNECLWYIPVLFEETIASTSQYDIEGCLCFLKQLQNEGQTLYRDAWLELQDNENIEMSKVSAMMFKTDTNYEIKLAEDNLRQNIKGVVKDALLRLGSIDEVKKTVDAMQKSLESFNTKAEADQSIHKAISSFEQLCDSDSTDITFSAVALSLQTVFDEAEHLSPETVDLLYSLGKSSSLLEFLRGIVDEDIRNLIDAVEDISEQYVRETTVSGLIEVKRFLQPLLKSDPQRTAHNLYQILETQKKSFGKITYSLPVKVDDCMENLHNLKSLYNNVANRGEQTKEIIKCVVTKGSFQFQLDPNSHECTFKASYTQAKNKTSHPSTALVDLRSRALLLMNTEKTNSDKVVGSDNLLIFVHYVNTCLDIAETVQRLFISGHVKYSSFHKSEPRTSLAALKDELGNELSHWQNCLMEERQTQYLMNFVQGMQIHTLHDFLENNAGERNVASILKFLHPRMDICSLQREYIRKKGTTETLSDRDMLHCIGRALHASYDGLSAFQRYITVKDTTGKHITETVRVGKLLVADLDEGSLSVVKTVLALYCNATEKYLEANQILFCTHETSWSEIELLLNRCLGAYSFYKCQMLFCIANVEILPNEIQFKLVEALRDLDGKNNFMLAVVCRGSSNHPFKDELSEYVMSVRPASDQTVRDIFFNECPDVRTITSHVAGLGKSTTVQTMAHDIAMGVVTLHISGPVRKGRLIERLRDLNIEPYHVLHLDIGSVDNPIELDTFLFELIILRYVTTGTVSFSLPTSHVSTEIANTINDSLRNTLQTAVSFARQHITWRDFSDFVVSKEIHSAVQIVCHFLEGIDMNSLDKCDLCFSGGNSVKPLSANKSRQLLKRYIGTTDDISFTVVNIFLQVLSDQLKKMSCSTFFKVSRIVDMIGHKTIPTVRSTLVAALVEVSKEFSSRSVSACRAAQSSTLAAPSADWPPDNHIIISVVC